MGSASRLHAMKQVLISLTKPKFQASHLYGIVERLRLDPLVVKEYGSNDEWKY